MGWKPLLGVLLLTGILHADVAVPRHGPLLAGGIIVDAKGGKLKFRDETQPLRGFLLVERDDGQLVWSPGIAERIKGYRRLVYERRRPKLVDLAKRAVRARDAVTARRLYEWAKKEGLAGREERIVRKRVENLEKHRHRMDDKKRAEVLREAKRLETALPDLLFARAKQNEDGRLRILRALLKEVPDHGPALDLVRAAIPKDSPFEQPRQWLTWHLDLESRGFRIADPERTDLKRAKYKWRPDLYGVESDGMLLVTPLRDLDVVAACALRMRTTIRTLARLFRTAKPLIRSRKPLTVHLFVNRRNFADQAGYERTVDVPPYFRWELGTFDAKENLTRLLRPEDSKHSVDRQLAYTLAHEVARHWMYSYCPRYSDRQLFNADAASGYGLRVGFFSLVAEAGFDLDEETIDFSHRPATSLRYVRKGPLFDWDKFFLMNMNDIHRLNGHDDQLYKAKRTRTTYGQRFMFQGGATCHYLYNAHNGRYRDVLIAFIANQYQGKQEKLNPRKVFGLDPAKLGAAVVAWAKQ